MTHFKLQAGCLAIILYIIFVYVKQTLNKKIPCNKIFDALLIITPWAVAFDGFTAWTVNNMDIVPEKLNLIAHGMFYVLMNITIIISYTYMLDVTSGIPTNKRKLTFTYFPAVLSLAITLLFLDKTEFIQGATTNYSMGISVFASYASLIIHFGMIFALLIVKHRTIEKRKKMNIVSCLLSSFIILIIQVIWPEVLITSLFPVFILLGLYINIEDPSMRRLNQYSDDMVTSFSTLVESRDDNTGGHIKRTRKYVSIIIDEMKDKPKYKNIMTKDYIKNIISAAPMHDIGKISTPDYILQKPGKLTDEEYSIMKQHSANGGEIIKKTFADLDEPDFVQIVYEVARFHHEKWNGFGYPDKLTGEQIPLHARIMAIADVFDAVSAKRCYRDAMPLEKCFQIIEEGSGKDFDPELVNLFLGAKDKVIEVYKNNSDEM